MLKLKRSLIAGLVVAVFLATPVWAQNETGALSGSVTDPDGAPLPGVAVTVESVLVPTVTVYTQANGNFRWPALPPGTERYTVTFQLAGFKTVIQESVSVRLGQTTSLDVMMELSSIEETVTVTGTSPIVDVKKTGTGQNLTEQYMQSIPSARDPWVMMQQTAGVITNQENIGGSESGQQGTFNAGGRTSDRVWTYDGAEMTDMSALGASPMYYDFDAFEEIAVNTGGNDPSIATGGIRINFVTKRGGSQWRGSGRLYITDKSLQSLNVGDPSTGELVGNYTADQLFPGYIGDSINNIKDFGGELGGPIVADRLFVWAAYGKQDIKQFVATSADNTQLKNIHGKASVHLGDRAVLNYTYLDAGKTKQGRGASSTRQGPTTHNQGGKCCIHTGKFQYTLNDNNYVEGSYNFTALGFFLEPQGGRDVPYITRNWDTGIWGVSYRFYDTNRPLKNARVDANTYVGGADVDHELKYGYSYRQANTRSESGRPGGAVAYYLEDGSPFRMRLYADAIDDYGNVRHSLYVGDTISADKLTLNVGLRFDNQASEEFAAGTPANLFCPECLPAIQFPGASVDFSWNSLSPRLGLTYRLSDSTILRANAARYGAQQFNGEFALRNNTGASINYFWEDNNGNGILEPGEAGDFISASGGFDRFNPNAPRDITILETRPPLTDELIFGLEHELNRELAVGADFTWKKNSRENWSPRNGETEESYWTTQDQTRTLADGTTRNITVWHPVNTRATSLTYQERNGFNTTYTAVTAYLNKRFSNSWMANGSVTLTNGLIEHYPTRDSYTDPTQIPFFDGKGTGSTLNAEWFAKGSLMYQLPAGVSLATFAHIRQGYGYNPSFSSATRPNGVGSVTIYDQPYNSKRTPTFWNWDFRAEKTLDVSDRARVHVILDVFNAAGNDTALSLGSNLRSSSTFGKISSVVQGRTVRIGGRLVLR